MSTEGAEVPTRPNPRFYVTVMEAARILGVSRQAILKAIKANRLRAIRFGITENRTAFYLIRKDDVRQYQREADLRKKATGDGAAK